MSTVPPSAGMLIRLQPRCMQAGACWLRQETLSDAVWQQIQPAAPVQTAVMAMQAQLGGSPSKQAQLRAYLRVKLAGKGPLDFDAPGGLDTSWQRIFLCLRCGFHQEALQVWLAFWQSEIFSQPTLDVVRLHVVSK